MKNFEITDISPRSANVQFENGIELELREMNIEDWGWVRKSFGADYAKRMAELETEELARIAFRLLKDKSPYKAEVVQEYNDDGELIEIKLTGPMKILRVMTGGLKDVIALSRGLMSCFGLPEKSLTDALENVEKKTQ